MKPGVAVNELNPNTQETVAGRSLWVPDLQSETLSQRQRSWKYHVLWSRGWQWQGETDEEAPLALVIVRLQDTSVSSDISKEPFLKGVCRSRFSSDDPGNDPGAWPCWASALLLNHVVPAQFNTSFFVWGFSLIVFKTAPHCTVLVGQEVTMLTRQVSKFQRFSCPCFPGAEIVSVKQHT